MSLQTERWGRRLKYADETKIQQLKKIIRNLCNKRYIEKVMKEVPGVLYLPHRPSRTVYIQAGLSNCYWKSFLMLHISGFIIVMEGQEAYNRNFMVYNSNVLDTQVVLLLLVCIFA